MNKDNFLRNDFKWSISRQILSLILKDKVSDIFVCELVWERLFYTKQTSITDPHLFPTFISTKTVLFALV